MILISSLTTLRTVRETAERDVIFELKFERTPVVEGASSEGTIDKGPLEKLETPISSAENSNQPSRTFERVLADESSVAILDRASAELPNLAVEDAADDDTAGPRQTETEDRTASPADFARATVALPDVPLNMLWPRSSESETLRQPTEEATRLPSGQPAASPHALVSELAPVPIATRETSWQPSLEWRSPAPFVAKLASSLPGAPGVSAESVAARKDPDPVTVGPRLLRSVPFIGVESSVSDVLGDPSRTTRKSASNADISKAPGPTTPVQANALFNLDVSAQLTVTEVRPAVGAENLQRFTIEIAPGSDAWDNKLVDILREMIDDGSDVAVVRLSPESLGDLEIGVAVRDGEVSVAFGANATDTRAAIEQALPKLRDLMVNNGLQLAHAGVFSSLPRDADRRPGLPVIRAAGSVVEDLGTAPEIGILTSRVRVAQGLVDFYV